ncbi:lysozyme inhibitor LprI family protein [Octadecabacter sp. 1_MG-2023]|uniref:lysozyme inhibitor LprI family protein n=1 Tax=unclassified Octadecabacter TaxID=196158 RepID=UPI001C09B8D0|nr:MULTISPECIES: lysozyme inhibitor LprI family protein [unclassified Octadecabacter]MBU2992702.1 DUF1311 domain-containing protein [Octadecabacter sp. B2R22]MDO6733847.1 lysozyme inhibitor LprI family protein [Octadecabacter sp. 1_MG-2023]
MLNKWKTLAVAVAFAVPMAAHADNCDQPNLTGFDSVYCFSKIYIGEDTRMGDNYRTMRSLLSSGEFGTLRQAQRNWLDYRDRTCMVGPTTVNVDCALNVTRARADFLQARITECRSVGCATSRLSEY